jgi:undecaprenyl pyrophosphate phosphatase UppP
VNPAAYVTLYLAIGAAVAATINWRWQRDSGRPLTAVDHLVGIGVAILWPFVTTWLVIGWLVDRLTPTRYP